MYEDFSWLPYYGIRIIFRYLSIITLLQQLDEFNEDFWKNLNMVTQCNSYFGVSQNVNNA